MYSSPLPHLFGFRIVSNPLIDGSDGREQILVVARNFTRLLKEFKHLVVSGGRCLLAPLWREAERTKKRKKSRKYSIAREQGYG